jgi:hypothetical protein
VSSAPLDPHPLAGRISDLLDRLPDDRQLAAAKELLLADDEDLPCVVERWEQQAGG